MIKYNNIKNIKEFIITFYLFTMSVFIIGIFVYYRIIFKRATYSLDTLKNSVDYIYLFINISFTCLHLFIILSIISTFIIKRKTHTLFEMLQKVVDILIWKPLNYFLNLISPHIPYSGNLILNYTYFFRKTELRLSLMKFCCFMFYFFPKIMMSSIFFIEIIFYHRLEIFIKYIWIFLIPLIYIIFLNLSEKFYANNIKDIENLLIITPTGDKNIHGVFTAHYFTLKENTGYTADSLKELSECWSILFYIVNLNKITRLFISQKAPYITFLTSCLYLSSFSYKIYYLYII